MEIFDGEDSDNLDDSHEESGGKHSHKNQLEEKAVVRMKSIQKMMRLTFCLEFSFNLSKTGIGRMMISTSSARLDPTKLSGVLLRSRTGHVH